jgi:hypothetical protein
MDMTNRVLSVPNLVLGASALISCLAVTPAAAWTHRHGVRHHAYAPHSTRRVVERQVVRRPVYTYGYRYPATYGYGYRPGAVAGGIVNGAGQTAAGIVGGAAALAGGILGGGYYGYPGYGYGYGYPGYAYGYGSPVW